MIIVQTPIRISFFGGGTDFPQFFRQEDGCVVSSAIDRYIYVVIKRRFDDKIRVGYSRTELVDSVDQLQHELVRESLRKTGIQKGIEISTIADIPSAGSGMGSSSSVTVGLLNAMYHYLGEPKERETLAREACEVEIDVLGKPIGMQDQYIAAYGGTRFMRFHSNGRVEVEPLTIDESTRRGLQEHSMLFFTNITRKSESVLAEQVCNLCNNMNALRTMKSLTMTGKRALERGDLDEFGRLLHEAWEIKKSLASKVTNGPINGMYEAARRAGALGGKITGAGGGGFLFLYCHRERQEDVRMALRDLPELPFRLEREGTKVTVNYGH